VILQDLTPRTVLDVEDYEKIFDIIDEY